MASRILGMGDMLSLIEKAQASFDEKARNSKERCAKPAFTDDFLDQMRQLKNGPAAEHT